MLEKKRTSPGPRYKMFREERMGEEQNTVPLFTGDRTTHLPQVCLFKKKENKWVQKPGNLGVCQLYPTIQAKSISLELINLQTKKKTSPPRSPAERATLSPTLTALFSKVLNSRASDLKKAEVGENLHTEK